MCKLLWGTGKDVFSIVGPTCVELPDGQKRVHYEFETAYTMPELALAKLSRDFPDVIVGQSFVNEDRGGARMMWKGGVALQNRVIFNDVPESCLDYDEDHDETDEDGNVIPYSYWNFDRVKEWQESLLLQEAQNYNVDMNERFQRIQKKNYLSGAGFVEHYVQYHLVRGRNIEKMLPLYEDLEQIYCAFEQLKHQKFCICHLHKEPKDQYESMLQFWGACNFIPMDTDEKKDWFQLLHPFMSENYLECNCSGDTYWNILLGKYGKKDSLSQHNQIFKNIEEHHRYMDRQFDILQAITNPFQSGIAAIFEKNKGIFETLYQKFNQGIVESNIFLGSLRCELGEDKIIQLAFDQDDIAEPVKEIKESIQEGFDMIIQLLLSLGAMTTDELTNEERSKIPDALKETHDKYGGNDGMSDQTQIYIIRFIKDTLVSYHQALKDIEIPSQARLEIYEGMLRLIEKVPDPPGATPNDSNDEFVISETASAVDRLKYQRNMTKLLFSLEVSQLESNQRSQQFVGQNNRNVCASLISLPLIRTFLFSKHNTDQAYDPHSNNYKLLHDVRNIGVFFQLIEVDLWIKGSKEDIEILKNSE